MKASEYIESRLGTPYKLGSDDVEQGLDCWGVVYDSFMAIDGLKLPPIERSSLNQCDDLYGVNKDLYETLRELEDGCIFCCFDSEGVFEHVGRVLNGLFIHSGSDFGGFSVWKLSVAKRLYSQGGRSFKCYRVKNGSH